MNRVMIGVMLTCVLAGASAASGQSSSETIRLRYMDAKQVPSLVKTTHGVDQIEVNFLNNSITIRGTAEALAALKTELAALDVKPIAFILEAKLVQYRVEAGGRHSETVVMSPTITTLEKIPARIAETNSTTGGYAVLLTPSRNADGSVTVVAEVQALGEQGEVVRSGRNEKRVMPGTATPVVGMTEAADKVLRRKVLRGEIVHNRGAYTGFYVEVRLKVDERK